MIGRFLPGTAPRIWSGWVIVGSGASSWMTQLPFASNALAPNWMMSGPAVVSEAAIA